MVVGFGENGVLLLGFCDDDIATWKQKQTVNFERGGQFLMTDVVTYYEPTREQLLATLKQAGVTVTRDIEDAIRQGRRTDHPRKPS